MGTVKVRHLKEILDPQARYVFIEDAGLTRALVLSRVEKDSLYLTARGRLPFSGRGSAEGYFTASDGKGVVLFSGALEQIPKAKTEKIWRLKPNLKSLELVNRRQFVRYALKAPLSIALECDAKPVRALLVNISEGGVRMSVSSKIPANVIYHFALDLPFSPEPLHFETDGLVLYCEPEERPERFMTGVTFVAPVFEKVEDQKTYQKSRERLAYFLSTNSELFTEEKR